MKNSIHSLKLNLVILSTQKKIKYEFKRSTIDNDWNDLLHKRERYFGLSKKIKTKKLYDR